MSPETEVPSSGERDKVRRRIQELILVQSNPFIRGLLHSKGATMGTTKKHFETALDTLAKAGALTLRDLDDWLDEVEGWGEQYVELYSVPMTLRQEALARTRNEVAARVRDQLGEGAWGIVPSELVFPPKMTLTGADWDGKTFRLVWYKGYPAWKRDEDMDRKETIQKTRYWFKAYRRVRRRAVMRFEIRRIDGLYLAALFIPARLGGKERRDAREEAHDKLKQLGLFSIGELKPVRMSPVIKHLDQAEFATKGAIELDVSTQVTRLGTTGSYVEFAADDLGHIYWESSAIRDIRKAVKLPQLKRLAGRTGVLEWTVHDPPSGIARKIRVWLYGAADQIHVKAQLDRDQIWGIAATLKRYQVWKKP